MVIDAWFRTPDDESALSYLLDPQSSANARQCIANWPFYRPSPLPVEP